MATTDVDVGAAGVDCAAQALTATPTSSAMTVGRAIRHRRRASPAQIGRTRALPAETDAGGAIEGGVGQEELGR